MNYERYIQSSSWQAKRIQRLEIDLHRCRQCGEDGTNHRLEVHHWPDSYPKIPDETMYDLVTLCTECHDLLTDKQRRMGNARKFGSLAVQISVSEIESRKDQGNGLENDNLRIEVRLSDASPQRPDSRPAQQILEGDETGFRSPQENRRRL